MMGEDNKTGSNIRKEIKGNSETSVLELEYIRNDNASVRVTTNIQSFSDIKNSASTLWSAVSELEKCEIAKLLQTVCYEKSGFYFPMDKSGAKMERLLVTVAANYPRYVSMDLMSDELVMDKKTISAYTTSANNWTSQYLYIENDADIRITTAGLKIAAKKTNVPFSK